MTASPNRAAEGSLIWETVAFEGAENQEAVVDVRIPTRFVRFLRLKSLTAADFEIAEFQVFSEGFVPAGRVHFQCIRLWRPGAFGPFCAGLQSRWATQLALGCRSAPALGLIPSRSSSPGSAANPLADVEQRGDTVFDIPIDVPWKKAEDVEDSELKNLVANVLDNEEIDGREALLSFGQLPFEQRAPDHPRPGEL